jgi:DNA-binding NarL/FixJ family response regulator
MKIVLVDDDVAMRQVMRAICESEGHEIVKEFGDGAGLLHFISTSQPDVVCLDYNLPGANGLDLLVNMDANSNHVDVIMVTGSDDPELKGHAADLGARGFIHKPFEQTQIIDELKAIMQTRGIAARAAATLDLSVPTAAPAPAPPPASGVVPRTAVVVDDSGSIRYLLKGILEDLGIKVVGFAANGKDGVELVRKTHPALVCLDVDMPIMSGLEALPAICAANSKTKVVMVTGNAGREIVQASISGGAKGYFLKPIRPAKVEEFMKKLLQL